LQILEQADAEQYLKDKKPTDAERQAEYDAQVAAMPKTQYHARHILLKTQEEAQKIIDELKKGAKFEDLAKKDSIDSSKEQGGDLGWFSPANMVKPFSEAVVALKKGETVRLARNPAHRHARNAGAAARLGQGPRRSAGAEQEVQGLSG
jgi:peptidyl-prolyl cis-trans isomerase C